MGLPRWPTSRPTLRPSTGTLAAAGQRAGLDEQNQIGVILADLGHLLEQLDQGNLAPQSGVRAHDGVDGLHRVDLRQFNKPHTIGIYIPIYIPMTFKWNPGQGRNGKPQPKGFQSPGRRKRQPAGRVKFTKAWPEAQRRETLVTHLG